MKPRSLPQNKLFHAMVRDIAKARPLLPWRRPMMCEAWKRFLIARWVHEARLEAYANGQPDPFPVRPVPSSSLDSWQMDELVEATYAFSAIELDLILK